uniref:ABC transporter substrate-binding protein n=1 Tax=Thermogemmatispora argillosa TaxID=2045280 RepID=A0A455SXL8_9CHLR|nr:ABC transporter substrate-binding protein [Thermogemmatispora argillosa]
MRQFLRRLVRDCVFPLWLLLVILLVTACGSVTVQSSGSNNNTTASGPLKIAVIPKAIGFDFWEQVHKGAECAASKQQQVSVIWNGVTAETDVTGQIDLLTNYITQHVNGLIYAATDARALYQVTQQALKANIPVVNIDSGTYPQPANVPLFATDNVASARKAADLLAQQLNGHGKVALIEFQPGSATNDQRVQGFKQELAKYPGIQLVADQSSRSDYNQALSVAEDILTAHPDLNGIFAANEPSVLGAAEAVRRIGKAGQITIIGWDAAPDEVKGVQQGTISALIVQNPFRMGYDSVNAMVRILRQHATVHSEDTGVTILTKANLNDPKVQAVLNPSCQNPPL